MPGDGAVMKVFGEWTAFARDAFEPRDLSLDRRGVVIVQFGLGLRCVLLFAHARKAMRQILDQIGEFLELASAPALRHAGKTRHPLRHVGLETDALLLPVIADVDAGFLLLRHDVAHRLFHLGVEVRLIVALARLAAHQKLAERLVARQAADMRRKDSVPAQDHDEAPGGSSKAPCHSAIPPE